MRIQFLSSSGQFGGAEACLLEMLAGIRKEYPDWSLGLIVPQSGVLCEKAAQLGVGTEILQFPRALLHLGDSKPAGGLNRLLPGLKLAGSMLPAFDYVRKLRRSIRSFSPDLIHTNGLKMSALGARAKDPALPMIWHIHDYVSSRPLIGKLLRLHARHAALLLANSNSVRNDLCASFKDAPAVETFYNAVDVNRFAPEGPKADLDRLSGLPVPATSVLRVGLVATMAWWKGHKDFVRALALLNHEKTIRGYIVGGPVYDSSGSQVDQSELSQFAAQLNLQERLGFTGFIEDPSCAMRALDVVVHASTMPEPFGRVIMEAMACGKPVITTAIGGATELVTLEKNALGFRPGDPVQLAERIRQLAHDRHLRHRLGEAARKTVLQKFDSRYSAKQLADFYRQVLCNTN